MIERLAELKEWVKSAQRAYANGGFAAGDAPEVPDIDLIWDLIEVAEAAEAFHSMLNFPNRRLAELAGALEKLEQGKDYTP